MISCINGLRVLFSPELWSPLHSARRHLLARGVSQASRPLIFLLSGSNLNAGAQLVSYPRYFLEI
jgi:hypothetical protein